MIPQAKASNHFCAKVEKHQYNSERNTLTVKLDRAIYTDEGNKTDLIDVITTQQKLMIKVAATRPNTKLCFQGLSEKSPEKLNAYLSEAAKSKVDLFKLPLPEEMTIVKSAQKISL